jgi:hypothetical protein
MSFTFTVSTNSEIPNLNEYFKTITFISQTHYQVYSDFHCYTIEAVKDDDASLKFLEMLKPYETTYLPPYNGTILCCELPIPFEKPVGTFKSKVIYINGD